MISQPTASMSKTEWFLNSSAYLLFNDIKKEPGIPNLVFRYLVQYSAKPYMHIE